MRSPIRMSLPLIWYARALPTTGYRRSVKVLMPLFVNSPVPMRPRENRMKAYWPASGASPLAA